MGEIQNPDVCQISRPVHLVVSIKAHVNVEFCLDMLSPPVPALFLFVVNYFIFIGCVAADFRLIHRPSFHFHSSFALVQAVVFAWFGDTRRRGVFLLLGFFAGFLLDIPFHTFWVAIVVTSPHDLPIISFFRMGILTVYGVGSILFMSLVLHSFLADELAMRQAGKGDWTAAGTSLGWGMHVALISIAIGRVLMAEQHPGFFAHLACARLYLRCLHPLLGRMVGKNIDKIATGKNLSQWRTIRGASIVHVLFLIVLDMFEHIRWFK